MEPNKTSGKKYTEKHLEYRHSSDVSSKNKNNEVSI